MIIPSINCPTFSEAREQINKAGEFAEWIHIDVSDGKFTEHVSWGNPDELRLLHPTTKVEVHLMVINPDEIFERWLKAGVKRIIIHLESAKDPIKILERCKEYEVEAMLAIGPSTPVEKLIPYGSSFQFFQILDVFPGPSGQKFQENSLRKIKILRDYIPNAKIEIDGGINPETAKLSKEAGADILVSGAYIFSSPDPQSAYYELASL